MSDEQLAEWPENVIRKDVTRGLPYDSSSVDAIYSSHMLEHLYMDQARRLLGECHRVLRPGGILRFALPDMDEVLGRYATSERTASDAMELHQDLGAWPLEAPVGRKLLISALGGSRHRWFPTFPLVKWMLERSGFLVASRKGFLEGELPDLESVETIDSSLFVETVR